LFSVKNGFGFGAALPHSDSIRFAFSSLQVLATGALRCRGKGNRKIGGSGGPVATRTPDPHRVKEEAQTHFSF
jgi:hypothetical protein